MTRDVVYQNLIYGRRVITNTPMWYDMPDGHRVNAELYEDYERYKFEIMRAHGALIVTDEMSLFYAASAWQNLEMDFKQKFLQAGKEGCDLYGTCQSLADVMAHLRRLAMSYYVCKKTYWLLPVPVDLRHNKYNKQRGFYDHLGFYWHTPIVFDAMKVDGGWFKSQALLPENRERFIHGRRRIYPSEYRRIMRCYDHEYHIKNTAVATKGGGGDLPNYYVFANWETYREAILDKKKKKPEKLSTINPQES